MVPQESASKTVSCEWFNTAGFCPQTQKQEPTLKDSIFHSERERGKLWIKYVGYRLLEKNWPDLFNYRYLIIPQNSSNILMVNKNNFFHLLLINVFWYCFGEPLIQLLHYFTDAKHTKLLLLLDSSLDVHVFPRTSEAKEIVSKAASSIFFFLADKEKGDIRGYMLLSDAGKSGFHVREMWNVNIPRSSQTISSIGNKRTAS